MEMNDVLSTVKDTLIDVQEFLQSELQNEKLSPKCRAERDRLVRHVDTVQADLGIKPAVQPPKRVSQPEEYLEMQGAVAQKVEEDDWETGDALYEGLDEQAEQMQLGSGSNFKIPSGVSGIILRNPSKERKTPIATSLVVRTQDLCPYSELSYMDALTESIKYGPLESKERFWKIRDVSRVWHSILKDQWLLFFFAESDPKPQSYINLIGCKVTECPNPAIKDSKKKDSCFEINNCELTSKRFYARSNKDMTQWVVAIENASTKHLTPRRLPTPPPGEAQVQEDRDYTDDYTDDEDVIYEEVAAIAERNVRKSQIKATSEKGSSEESVRLLNYDVPRTSSQSLPEHVAASQFGFPTRPPLPNSPSKRMVPTPLPPARSTETVEVAPQSPSRPTFGPSNAAAQSQAGPTPLVKTNSFSHKYESEHSNLRPPAVPAKPIVSPKRPSVPTKPKPDVPQKPNMANWAKRSHSMKDNNPQRNDGMINELVQKLQKNK